MTPGNAVVTATFDYTAFGSEYYTTGGSGINFRYGGAYGYFRPTSTTPLLYVRNRWYDPLNGVWLSRDLIGFDGEDWNLYRYVSNSPVSDVDPRGSKMASRKRKGKGNAPAVPPPCTLPYSKRPAKGTFTTHYAVREAVKKMLNTCPCNVTKYAKHVDVLASALACIANGESSYDLSTLVEPSNTKNPADDYLYGLFQPSCNQLHRCGATADYWSLNSQVKYMVNLTGLVKDIDGSVYEGLYAGLVNRIETL